MSDRDYGCSSSACIFGPQGGQMTNGGCRCIQTIDRDVSLSIQRGVRALRERAEAAEAALGRVRNLLPSPTLPEEHYRKAAVMAHVIRDAPRGGS